MDDGNQGTPPADKKSLLHPPVLWDLLKATYEEWRKDNAQTLGAALAFYTTFSMAPLLILIIAIFGIILGKEAVQMEIMRQVRELIGEQGAGAVKVMIEAAYRPGTGKAATLIGIFVILVGSTSAFVMLQQALNIMWGAKPNHASSLWDLVKNRLLSFVMILFVGLLLVLSLIQGIVVAALTGFLQEWVSIPGVFLQLSDLGFTMLLVTLLFALIFKVLPEVDIAWSDVWVGAAITSLLFTLGKFLIGLYLARSTISSAYGAASSLAIMLMWVYYSAQVFFLGAEFTQVYANRFGSRVAPHRRAR